MRRGVKKKTQQNPHSFEWRRRRVRTYGEQDDGDGQRDGGEDGHSHAQDQSVVRVDAAVRVQQLRFHVACGA